MESVQRKFININISPVHMLLNVALMGAMTVIMLKNIQHWAVYCVAITLIIIVLSVRPLLVFAKQLLKGLMNRKRGNA